MQVIISMLRLQASTKPLAFVFKEAENKIQAMASSIGGSTNPMISKIDYSYIQEDRADAD